MRVKMTPPIELPDMPEFDGPSKVIEIDDETGDCVVECEGGRHVILGARRDDV